MKKPQTLTVILLAWNVMISPIVTQNTQRKIFTIFILLYRCFTIQWRHEIWTVLFCHNFITTTYLFHYYHSFITLLIAFSFYFYTYLFICRSVCLWVSHYCILGLYSDAALRVHLCLPPNKNLCNTLDPNRVSIPPFTKEGYILLCRFLFLIHTTVLCFDGAFMK